MVRKSPEQMRDDLEMEERVARQAAQEQSNLDAQALRGGPFPPWYLDKLAAKNQQPDGSEIPDPTVMEPPIGYQEMPSIMEAMYNMIRQERARQGDLTDEPDTPDQADDFDVDDPDDLEPESPYEFERNFEPNLPSVAPSPEAPGNTPAVAQGTPPQGAPGSEQGGAGGGAAAPPASAPSANAAR